MEKKLFDIRTVVMLGLLTAMEIVLSRFCSISAWNIKIGFSFIPVAAAAILFGPLQAGTVAALGDFLGAILFPIGAYFPGFTLTAFLTGATFGLFLHKKQSAQRIGGAVVINQLVLSLLLNTLWISILYGAPFHALFLTRILQCAVSGPIQFAALCAVSYALNRHARGTAS